MLTKQKDITATQLYKWSIVLVTDSADFNRIPGWRRILCGSVELIYVERSPQVVLPVRVGKIVF